MRILAGTGDAETVLSQPGLGSLLGPWVLGDFGDNRSRYATAKARKNYAADSPITRASGKRRSSRLAPAVGDRLVDALNWQAFSSLQSSPCRVRSKSEQFVRSGLN